MNFIDLIIKKRDKKELTTTEIQYFVESATKKEIPDYQLSSMLMAMFLNGLNTKETSDLTMAMAKSGEILDLSKIEGIKVDKHSTGGVADTTTLILAPLTAACGLPVVKMSGKGLGHTGGTIDKLESIPGFNTEITNEQAIKLVKENNIVIMGQTKNLAPADKILYSMRDVTGTVESIPLIASSIMSKKIAAGCDALVLDVKCGNGAFMKDYDSAEKLAQTMIKIGESIGKKVSAIISDMNEPLGTHIGNSLEVIEAIEILKNNLKDSRLREVSLELGSILLVLGKICKTKEEGLGKLIENIENGKGLEKFRQLIISQGGNPKIIEDYSLLPLGKCKYELKSEERGYINSTDTYNIGRASSKTGAGRKTKEDKIDYGAGIILKHSVGDKVEKGDVLAEIYASTEEKCTSCAKILKSSIIINQKSPEKRKAILNVIL